MEGELRENYVNVLIGDRFAGKTTFTRDVIIPAYLAAGKPVILVQRKYNPKYDKLKDDPRVLIKTVTVLEELIPVLEQFYNGGIIFEDAYRYFGNKLTDEVIGLIVDTQQQNNDIHFIYHTFSWVCKDLFRIADMFTFFGCNESAASRSDYFTAAEIKDIDEKIKNLKPYENFVFQR